MGDEMEKANSKRMLAAATFQDVNWSQLFLQYSDDLSETIDTNEFTFLVKDLLSLRDNYDSVSLENAISVSKRILSHFSFLNAERSSPSPMITASKLGSAATKGAFDEEQFTPDHFIILSGNDSAMPQLQRDNSQSLIAERNTRPLVRMALRDAKLSKNRRIGAENLNLQKGRCAVCFEEFDIAGMYGGGNIRKSCTCNILLCIPCIATSARSQILEGRRPTCPNMLSSIPPRRCQSHIDQSLTAQLFKNICPLCTESATATNPLLSVGCAHDVYHSFCAKCLYQSIHSKLDADQALQCPRFAECRFELDEAAVRKIFLNFNATGLANAKFRENSSCFSASIMADVEFFIEKWYIQRVNRLKRGYSGNKNCCTPGCHGIITASLSKRRSAQSENKNVVIECTECRKMMCWSCSSLSHPTYTCAEAFILKAKWMQFLKLLANSGEKGSSSASNTLLRYEQTALDTLYFKKNIMNGNMKKCPRCFKLIEKLQGCDSMVCGENGDGGNKQSGCGHTFAWSDVPVMDVSNMRDLETENASISLGDDDFDIYLTEDHFNVTDPRHPVIMQCSVCLQPISGTKFKCIHCQSSSDDKSEYLCLSCVRKEIDSKSDRDIHGTKAITHSSKKCQFADLGTVRALPSASSVTSLHQDHSFKIISPPNVHSAIMAPAVCSLESTGLQLGALGTSSFRSAVSNRSNSRPSIFGRSHFRANDATLVLIELHPNGKLFYADNHCRAVEWISLDGIVLKASHSDTGKHCPPVDEISLEESFFLHGDCKALPVVTLRDVPLAIVGGGTIFDSIKVRENDLRTQLREEKKVEVLLGYGSVLKKMGSSCSLSAIRYDKKNQLYGVQVQPSTVKCDSDQLKSFWNDLPDGPIDSYSIRAQFLIHGAMCYISGDAVKDFASCSLVKRTTNACLIQEGDLVTVLPRDICPLAVHDFVVFIDDSETKVNSIERSVAAIRLHPDGRMYVKSILGTRVKYPLRILLNNIRFPIQKDHSTTSLMLGPNVFNHPRHKNSHNMAKKNIYCNRKRSASNPCSCGNCHGHCGPSGCPCPDCTELERSLVSTMMCKDSKINDFAIQCKKFLKVASQMKAGATTEHDILDFAEAMVADSPGEGYCSLSGQVFKHPECSKTSISFSAEHLPSSLSPNDNDNNLMWVDDNLFGVPVEDINATFEMTPPLQEPRRRTGHRQRRRQPNFGTDNIAKCGVWVPGDLIATLPPHFNVPKEISSFVALAGKGALGDEE